MTATKRNGFSQFRRPPAAFAAFLLSVYLYFLSDDKTAGIFVGIWVPSIHSLGTLLLAGQGYLR